ncbi:MAG: hypothetical protein ACI8TQ_000852 [Planctomycetota bacterium]|jgi:hypothetical protein
MIALSLIAACIMSSAVAVAPDALGDATPRVALFELTGPTAGGRLSCGESEARLDLALASGEERQVRVPFSHVPEETDLSPVAVAWGSGTARFLSWEASSRESDWSSLPAGLRRRPIPVPPGTRSIPATAGWLVLIAGLISVRLFGKRQGTAAILGLTAGAVLLLLPVTETVGSDEAIVMEGLGATDEGNSDKWVRVAVQSQSATVSLDRLLRLAVLPEDAQLSWLGTASADGEISWSVEGAGGESVRTISCERIYLPYLRPAANDDYEDPGMRLGFPLSSTWIRFASGDKLVSYGAWEFGTPLPTPPEDQLGPPSWLAAGLPQGVSVLLGRSENELNEEFWVRLIGFSEE